MSRKITTKAALAFCNGYNFKKSNTEVSCVYGLGYGVVNLYLNGNCIASRMMDANKFTITTCGRPTQTTKERLNCLPNVNLHHKSGILLLNGEPWDGMPITINF